MKEILHRCCSQAVPPKRKKPGLAQIPSGTIYGGAGTFSEDLDEPASAPKPVPKETSHAPIPSYMRPESQIGISASTSGRFASTSAGSQGHYDLIPPSQSVPISLRPSSSLAQLDTYTPPYAPPRIQREKSPAPTSYLEQRRMSIPVSFPYRSLPWKMCLSTYAVFILLDDYSLFKCSISCTSSV